MPEDETFDVEFGAYLAAILTAAAKIDEPIDDDYAPAARIMTVHSASTEG